MGYLQSSTTSSGVSSHLYSQALQMKLYQAFIFSIPILFSIILFLLFYLFYLKRTFSNNNPSSIFHQRTSRTQDSSTLSQCSETVSKINLEDKLTMIAFNEDLYTKELMCCVCLGEFEMNEQLHQIPLCQHMFHIDCIRNWLYSNTTCPLCRCSVVNTSKDVHNEQVVVSSPAAVNNIALGQQEFLLDHCVVISEGSSSSSMDNKISQPNEEFVVVNVQLHDS